MQHESCNKHTCHCVVSVELLTAETVTRHISESGVAASIPFTYVLKQYCRPSSSFYVHTLSVEGQGFVSHHNTTVLSIRLGILSYKKTYSNTIWIDLLLKTDYVVLFITIDVSTR